MNPVRTQKIKNVIRQSQPDLTVVLENIFDPLNISAVLRSCDAVGVREVFVIYTKPYLDKRGLILGKRTSGGTFKWIDVYVFEDVGTCFQRVRERYGRILATHLGAESTSLYDCDLSEPTALLFGNEDEGISREALALSDGNFTIPMAGFAESLNISVACAVSLFEARRQRAAKGYYSDRPLWTETQQEALFERWKGMLKEKSHLQQQTEVIGKEHPPMLPVYARRDPKALPKKQIRPAPLTKFDL